MISLSPTGEQTEPPGPVDLHSELFNLLDLPELVTVTQDQVHVFVKGLEGADEDPAVLQDAPHPEVNVLQHLTALTHRLKTNHSHTLQ